MLTAILASSHGFRTSVSSAIHLARSVEADRAYASTLDARLIIPAHLTFLLSDILLASGKTSCLGNAAVAGTGIHCTGPRTLDPSDLGPSPWLRITPWLGPLGPIGPWTLGSDPSDLPDDLGQNGYGCVCVCVYAHMCVCVCFFKTYSVSNLPTRFSTTHKTKTWHFPEYSRQGLDFGKLS